MSLINKMLRDLDGRRANQDVFKELPVAVAAASPERKMRLPSGQVLRLTALVVAGGLAWWAMQHNSGFPPPPQLPALQPTSARPESAPEAPSASTVASPQPDPQPSTAIPSTLPPDASVVGASSPAAPTELKAKAAISPSKDSHLKDASSTKEIDAKANKPAAPSPQAPQSTPSPASEIQKTAIPASSRERADADIRRAQAYLNAGQSSDAVDLLRSALAADPSYPTPRQMLFKVLVDGKKTDAAISLLQDGLELLPQQLSWSMSVARLQVDRKDYTGAEKTLAKAAAYAVKNADYFGFYGHVQQKLGEHKKAIDTYQSAIRINPAEGRWWMGLASALEAEKRVPEAREAYRQALETGTLSESLAALAEKKLVGN